MAERYVSAASIFLSIGPHSGSLKTAYCIVDITRNNTTNINDAASICNPTNKVPGTQDSTVGFNAQRAWDVGGTHYSENYLHDAWKNKTLIDYTIGPATPVTGDIVESGTGYITSFNETDNATDYGSMDVTITCTVTPTQTITV
jgi:hypothetical protein